MKVSANLEFLWADMPLLQRIDAAARAGFRAVELHQPFEVEPKVLKARCRDAGVQLLGINTGKGSQADDQGLAAVPGRQAEARALIEQALTYATEANATAVHILAGQVPPEQRSTGRAALLASLDFAEDIVRDLDLMLQLEPLNEADAPGYFYSRVPEATALIREHGGPQLRLMLDLYHVAMMGDDPVALIGENADIIGHVQIAGVPGRHEPDSGSYDFAPALAALKARGYIGWIGAEYRALAQVEDGLKWCAEALKAAG